MPKSVVRNRKLEMKLNASGHNNAAPTDAINVYLEKLLKSTLRPTKITGNNPNRIAPRPIQIASCLQAKLELIHVLLSLPLPG